MVEFRQKLALITGAGSGIGEAIALQFASRGCNLLLAGRRMEQLERVAVRCADLGVDARPVHLDLEDSSSVEAFVRDISESGTVIDFFVLNAGVSQRAMTLDSDISVDRKLMEVNYFGSIGLIKGLKDMILGMPVVHIAVVSSISGLFGFPLRSAYCASKHAIHGFYESLALEYPNIKVTILMPGRIRTEISKSALLSNGEQFGKMDKGQANGMPAERCARIAVRAIARERHSRLIGGPELLMAFFYRYMRGLYWLLAGRVSAH